MDIFENFICLVLKFYPKIFSNFAVITFQVVFFPDTNETINRKLLENEALIARISEYDVTMETLLDDVASFRSQLASVQQDVTLNNQMTRRVDEVVQKVTELEEGITRKALLTPF